MNFQGPIAVASPSMAWVCGCSLAGIARSNPARAWVSVTCDYCMLSGRGLCNGPIPRPEESNRVYVCVCVLLSVIIYNSNSLHLQWVGRRGQTKNEREK